MEKQLQTVYVPCDDGELTIRRPIEHTSDECFISYAQEQSVYLYTPEEHAQAEKMREALERIDNADEYAGWQLRIIASEALR